MIMINTMVSGYRLLLSIGYTYKYCKVNYVIAIEGVGRNRSGSPYLSKYND